MFYRLPIHFNFFLLHSYNLSIQVPPFSVPRAKCMTKLCVRVPVLVDHRNEFMRRHEREQFASDRNTWLYVMSTATTLCMSSVLLFCSIKKHLSYTLTSYCGIYLVRPIVFRHSMASFLVSTGLRTVALSKNLLLGTVTVDCRLFLKALR